jgi:hypothetical protein
LGLPPGLDDDIVACEGFYPAVGKFHEIRAITKEIAVLNVDIEQLDTTSSER